MFVNTKLQPLTTPAIWRGRPMNMVRLATIRANWRDGRPVEVGGD